jgi:hypothetical protein
MEKNGVLNRPLASSKPSLTGQALRGRTAPVRTDTSQVVKAESEAGQSKAFEFVGSRVKSREIRQKIPKVKL